MKIGDRVVTPRCDVGYVEEIDANDVDTMVCVRCLTPKGELSTVSSWCFPDELSDGSNVYPMPKSKAWFIKAREHYLALEQHAAELLS